MSPTALVSTCRPTAHGARFACLVILHTSNGGTTWAAYTSGTTQALSSLWGSNANNLWAVGGSDSATILRSTNGGANWVADSTVLLMAMFRGLWGTDANHKYIAGTHGIVYTSTPVDSAPAVATNTGISLQHSTSETIANGMLKVTDADNDGIIYTLVTAPTKGTLKRNNVTLNLNDTFTQAGVDANLLSYTAGSTLDGDSFHFSASDGYGGSVAGSFNITIILSVHETWRRSYFVMTANTGNAADDFDADGDGQDNQFEFVAGLHPLDPASRLVEQARAVNDQLPQMAIVFSPIVAGLPYVVKLKEILTDPTWTPLYSFTTWDDGAERTVLDIAPPGAKGGTSSRPRCRPHSRVSSRFVTALGKGRPQGGGRKSDSSAKMTDSSAARGMMKSCNLAVFLPEPRSQN